MSRQSRLAAVVVCLIAASGALMASGSGQRGVLDALLTAYQSGDTEIVRRTFVRSRVFHELRMNDAGSIARWLGAWQRAKAVMLLEIARASTEVAPNYTAQVLAHGRRYLELRAATDNGSAGEAFADTWHHTALGLLEGVGNPIFVDEYLDAIAKAGGAAPSRATLARAIAQELRCWETRPLDQAGESVEEITRAVDMTARDLDAPRRARRLAQAEQRRLCLREASVRFEAAAASEVVRSEARTRGAWILHQENRPKDALERLQGVSGGSDSELGYWAALFRGRVLDSLGRASDAVSAYRDALKLFPNAQSAGVGLVMALFRSDQDADADVAARELRAKTARAVDPWTTYLEADRRFVHRWIEELRGASR